MKKLTLLFILAFIIQSASFSQSCLPDGIIFTTQEEIDNFQTNYPGCTEIEGDVEINGEDIDNLNGLNVLTEIGGYLQIGSFHFSTNLDMTNLSGLENLTYIGSDLIIRRNYSLTDLSALENITTINGELRIVENFNLTNLHGLNNITSIAENLRIDCNRLSNLSGLENLTSIGGEFWIESNNLVNFIGLNNLAIVGGNFSVVSCENITNLNGLESLTSIGGGLLFSIVYNLHNFTGLNNLVSIGDFFSLYHLPYLTSLEGLESLTSVGGELSFINNNSLANLSGLSNLNSIDGNFIIDDNDDIITFSGFENLTSINGIIRIKNNKDLINLSGLENIEANSISRLDIYDNLSLAYCQIQNICNYLAIPNADINIHDNATGCNSREEVEYACGIGIPDITNEFVFTIYPNPAQNNIYISGKEGEIINEVNIYNQLGQKVISEKQSINVIDVSKLSQGIYVVELISDNLRVREKLMVR